MMKEKPGSKRNLMMSAFPLSSLALLLTFSKDVSSSSSSTERESLIPGLVSGQFSPRRRSATFRGTDCHNKGNKAKQIYHGQSQPDAARIQDSTWLANDQSVAAYNNLLHLLIFLLSFLLRAKPNNPQCLSPKQIIYLIPVTLGIQKIAGASPGSESCSKKAPSKHISA